MRRAIVKAAGPLSAGAMPWAILYASGNLASAPPSLLAAGLLGSAVLMAVWVSKDPLWAEKTNKEEV